MVEKTSKATKTENKKAPAKATKTENKKAPAKATAPVAAKTTAKTAAKTTAKTAAPAASRKPRMTKKEQRDMRSRAGNEERKESVRAKALAFEMEKVNTDMIILFPSTRGWYKMGGKSAMFYWTYVAKSIGRRVKLRSDTDRYSTFSEGVISIKKLKLLEEKLAEVNAFPVKEGVPKGLIAFKLERPFTEEEIRQMYHTQEMLTEKINQMVRPKVTMPQLNAALYDLLKKIKSAIGQMNSWQCQAFGLPEMEQLLRLREGYMVLGDGLAAPGSTLVDMLRTSERLKNNITLAEEVSAWEKGKALKALEDLVLIDRIVREKLHIKDDRVGVPLPPREGQK